MFQFNLLEARQVRSLLKCLPESGSAGSDSHDSKLLNIAADHISGPLSHMSNRCLSCGVHPRMWKEGKIIPLIKDKRSHFCEPNKNIRVFYLCLVRLCKRSFTLRFQATSTITV